MTGNSSAPDKRDARIEVRILRDHDYRHTPTRIQAFRVGETPKVKPSVAKALEEAGVIDRSQKTAEKET